MVSWFGMIAGAWAKAPQALVLAAQVQVAPQAEHPVGVVLTAEDQFGLGAQACGWSTSGACKRIGAWPLIAPGVSVGWRGGRDLELTASVAGGVAGLDVLDIGFKPYFEAMGRVGGRWSLGEPHVRLIVGGTLVKDASFRARLKEPPDSSVPTAGATFAAWRLDGDLGWAPGDAWTPTIALGGQIPTRLADFL